jgi:hypothetical protein
VEFHRHAEMKVLYYLKEYKMKVLHYLKEYVIVPSSREYKMTPKASKPWRRG